MPELAPSNPVAIPTKQFTDDEANRTMLRAMRKGPRGMLEAGPEYLDKLEAETNPDFSARLRRSYPFFYNAVKRAVRGAVGKVFSREVRLGDDVPQQLKDFCEDVDLAGNNLHNFTFKVFEDAWWDGVAFIFVDMQKAPAQTDANGDARPLTVADNQRLGLRPYMVRYTAQDLIGFRAVVKNGAWRVTQARLMECADIEVGEYGSAEEHRIRVVFAGDRDTGVFASYEVWALKKTSDGKDEWSISTPLSDMVGMFDIPLVPVYTERTGYLRGCPPFLDLGYLNLGHWQLSSDLREIEYVANTPVPVTVGAGEEQKRIPWGAHHIWNLPPNASAFYLEHKGMSIGELKKTIESTEIKMRSMSLEPALSGATSVAVQATQTATGERLRSSEAHSDLQRSAFGLKDSTERSLGYMGEWIGLGQDAGGSVDVATEFTSGSDQAAITALQAMRNRPGDPDLSREGMWEQMAAREVLSDDFDPVLEAERLDKEAAMNPPEPLPVPSAVVPDNAASQDKQVAA